jgi:hypothetical protein
MSPYVWVVCCDPCAQCKSSIRPNNSEFVYEIYDFGDETQVLLPPGVNATYVMIMVTHSQSFAAAAVDTIMLSKTHTTYSYSILKAGWTAQVGTARSPKVGITRVRNYGACLGSTFPNIC